MWLGSFFSLLFITFCVSKNLDELNPHITNVQKEHDTVITKESDSNLFVNDINIEEISNIPLKDDKPEVLHIERKIDENITLPTTFIEPKKEEPKKEEPKKEEPKKEEPKKLDKKTTKPNVKTKKPVAKKSKSSKKVIEKISLSLDEVANISSGKENNNLNKIAFYNSINKNSFVQITAPDLVTSKIVKVRLIKRRVKNIKIKIDKNIDEVKLKLIKERN
jgi:hypothetical protein